MNWQLLPAGTERVWDQTLASSADANAFQSFGWGEYRRTAGWSPQRWIALDGNGRPVMMAQILTRTTAGVLVGWAPGGPVLRFPDSATDPAPDLLESLFREIRRVAPFAYVRFDCHLRHAPDLTYAFGRSSRRPLVSLNTRFSSTLDLSRSMEEILAGMGHKHRYNTKRALRQPIEWTMGNDDLAALSLAALYSEVIGQKRLRLRAHRAEDLRNLCRRLGEHASILTGRVRGEPVTALLVLLFGHRAFLLLPATGRSGRALGAGYAMHYRLFEHLRDRGITAFDLGGLDPNARMGDVDRFKLGFGGSVVEYVGEWEWASHPWLRWGAGLAVLARRSAIRRP